MRTISKVPLFFFVCFISFVASSQVIEQEILDPIKLNIDPLNYTRHKPNKYDETNNIFSTREEYIKLLIPITTKDNRFKIDRVFNISRSPFGGRHINGILVVLDGIDGDSTDLSPVKKFIKAKIQFSQIQGKALKKGKLSRDTKLVVWVVHDNEIGKSDNEGQCQLKTMRKYFKTHAKSYKFKVPKSIKYKCNTFDILDILEPKEQDGDVIGGN